MTGSNSRPTAKADHGAVMIFGFARTNTEGDADA